ncbi:MAG: 50S ribosomal protein L9 [Pseudomonadota bacterium]|nr:50S ribosomal protein L9 [Pseudomonadota bacterium]
MVQVVLLEKIAKLGIMGDVVSVKPGYARNFLLPQRKALRATEENLKKFDEDRAKLEALNLETKQEAQKVKDKIDGKSFTVLRSASETGSLYGSVTSRDAEKAMALDNIVVTRKQIVLSKPIKELGLHEITISLHPEVSATIKLNVARSLEEAELQKSGKSIEELKKDADVDNQIDVLELFDDVENASLIEDDTNIAEGEEDSGDLEKPEAGPSEKDISSEHLKGEMTPDEQELKKKA